jgi:predicted nuclease of predicted toxin-antitoxin system
LKLLLDEHIWPGVASLVKQMLPTAQVESIHDFADGRFTNCADATILQEAVRAGYTLVTFDVNTIPVVLHEMALAREDHGGVVFISSKTFVQNDHHKLARALVDVLRKESDADWANRAMFLSKV